MEAYWIPLHEDNAEAAFDPLVVLKVHSEIKMIIKCKNILFLPDGFWNFDKHSWILLFFKDEVPGKFFAKAPF